MTKLDTRRTPELDIYRAKKTAKFISATIGKRPLPILDIGERNLVGKYLKETLDIILENTNSDLDYTIENYFILGKYQYNRVFCFEVIEHLLNPRYFMDNLHKVTTEDCQVFLSYPSRPKFLWNPIDHFHEYDKKRFNFLLEATGWKIIRKGKIRLLHRWWFYLTGFRPILRLYYDYTNIFELCKVLER